MPVARLIGSLEATNWTSKQWALGFRQYCARRFDGRQPTLNIGDPAGHQHAPGKKTSIIEDLAQHGIIITTPPRKPQDYGVRILNNMMEGGRVLVDREHASRLGAAIASHRWKVDSSGNRVGSTAVHDWTSHYCDGVRYWATILFSVFPRREPRLETPAPGPGTMGYIRDQVLRGNPAEWLGDDPVSALEEWEPGLIIEREDGRMVAGG